MAREKGLSLREAIVYSSHPQIQVVKDEFAKVGDSPTHVSVNFSMSGFENENFRYSLEKGGGAIYDLSSYALTIGEIFFGSDISDIFVVDTSSQQPAYSVDTGFSILIKFEGGQTVTGHFGFETEYINQITLLGKKLSVQFERIFTITPEMSNTLKCRAANMAYSIQVPAGNTFGIFFRNLIEEIESSNDFTKNYTDMDKLHKNIDKLIKGIK
jgi:predicted dehydrogenase